MQRDALISQIQSALSDRASWETKQGDLYRARFRGLRRSNPPWPNASDINWPLIDSIIERLKPHYFQQLYASDLIASFSPAVPDPEILKRTSEAAAWFDYELKQRSNLEKVILQITDTMLMLGRPAVKVTWEDNDDGGQLRFTHIAPDKLILPPDTEDIDDADWLVHVMSFTPDRYKRNNTFAQGDDLLARITGSGADAQETGGNQVRDARLRRTGITEGTPNEIIVWEAWIREGDGWCRETFSPVHPEKDLREAVEYDDEAHPFVDFAAEVTQPDWYSPRGIGEIVLPFQAQLTKLLNEKNDALTLSNRPLFRAEREGADSNFRMRPGQLLPIGVAPVTMPAPPISFDVAINQMREVAEGLIGTPDFGLARQGNNRQARTATEMEQIAAMNSQSSDLRMRVFRQSLSRLYGKAWDILVRETSDGSRTYWKGDGDEREVGTVSTEVRTSRFVVRPSGSADGISRQRLWQKAMARLQTFANDPFVDQMQLRASVLEADDPGLVRRLLRDPGVAQATQAEEQAMEINVIRTGFPAVVSTADDHETHIRTVLMYIAQQNQTGQPPQPLEMGLLQQHLRDHVQALNAVNPKAARAAMDAIQTVGTALTAGAEDQGVAA